MRTNLTLPKFTTYFDQRTMSSMRGSEPLSPRLMCIVDRYLMAVNRDRRRIRSMFSDEQWSTLLDVLQPAFQDADSSPIMTSAFLLGVEGHPDLNAAVMGVTGGDLLVLIELLETELMTGVAMTPAR